MKVAIYSRTPLAAAPWELYKALRKYTLLDVTLVNEFTKYADGRTFPHHLLMSSNNGDAKAALRNADVWHVHNYLTRELRRIRRNQPVVAQFHSLPRLGNWRELMDWANVCYTIAQPLQIQEYKLPGLPNIIDPDELRPRRREKKITIAFAPTNRAPMGRPDSKGYHQVKATLNRIATERDVEILWIEGRPYQENLEMKARAHILIDDVVTGNWHRTSLEGACLGCAVLNRNLKVPWVHANLETLREKLLWLIDSTRTLHDHQERSRLWALQNWHPIEQLPKYIRAYEGAANAR